MRQQVLNVRSVSEEIYSDKLRNKGFDFDGYRRGVNYLLFDLFRIDSEDKFRDLFLPQSRSINFISTPNEKIKIARELHAESSEDEEYYLERFRRSIQLGNLVVAYNKRKRGYTGDRFNFVKAPKGLILFRFTIERINSDRYKFDPCLSSEDNGARKLLGVYSENFPH